MIIDCDIDLDSLNEPSVNEIPALPDIDTVMAELNVLGGDQSPPADFVMPTDYYPASPIYSPASQLIKVCKVLACHQLTPS